MFKYKLLLTFALLTFMSLQSMAVEITKLVLINTATNQPVAGFDPLVSGAQINLATVNANALSIQAFTSGATLRVVFNLTGSAIWNQTEGVAPYALFGDASGAFTPWKPAAPQVGNSFTLVATPINPDGTTGTAVTVSFSFVNQVAPPPPPAGLTVSAMTLVNALNDQDIKVLQNGETIDLATLATDQLNIRATVTGGTAGSVVLESTGPVTITKNENIAPFAMFGDNGGGDYYAQTFTTGQYTFKSTPYSAVNGGGTVGTALTLNVTFVKGGVTPPPPPPAGLTVSAMTLVNAVTDQDIKVLQSGETIDLTTLGNDQLNIRATVTGGAAGSVILESTGPVTITKNENVAPFAMFGDNGGGDYTAQTFTTGQYTFKSTPYSAANGGGTVGTALTLNVTFTKSGVTPPPPPPTGTTGAFIESNGLVVMEVESVPLQTGWKQGTLAGVTFYEATVNSVGSPGAGVLNYNIQVTNPGIYRIVTRTRINVGTSGTEHNDTWIKMPNNADVTFFAYQGIPANEAALQNALNINDVLYPNGTGKGPNPAGASTSGYFKMYMNELNKWVWLSVTSDFDPHDIYVKFAKAGTYTLQLSNRSAGHAVDRMALYRVNTYGYNYNGNLEALTNLPQSARVAARVAAASVNNLGDNLTVYPNPVVSEGQITISNNNKEVSKVNIALVDRLGKIAYSGEQVLQAGQNAEIDLSKLNLQKGTYTLSYHNGTERIVKTIVIR
ncbi:MAG: T9SS type A sorting domain-containing protein [Microscillaceae bacterium]|nr:T9SS type A sorting domain-containing protein [Microscillaceae bacterium]